MRRVACRATTTTNSHCDGYSTRRKRSVAATLSQWFACYALIASLPVVIASAEESPKPASTSAPLRTPIQSVDADPLPLFTAPSIEDIARIRQSLGAAFVVTPATLPSTLPRKDFAGQNVAGQNVAGQNVAGQNVAGQGVAGQGVAGAGVASQATVPESADRTDGDHAFVAALRRIAQPANPRTGQPDHLLASDTASDTASDSNAATPVDAVGVTIATLRNSARELDLQAYELDDQRNRASSKRLRRLAQSLRREADRLDDGRFATDRLDDDQSATKRLENDRSPVTTPMDATR